MTECPAAPNNALLSPLEHTSPHAPLARIGPTNESAADRIDRIRHLIANGHYETPDRMDVAIDRMIHQLAG